MRRRSSGVALAASLLTGCLLVSPVSAAPAGPSVSGGSPSASAPPATGSAPVQLGPVDPQPTQDAAVPTGGTVLSPSDQRAAAVNAGGTIRQLNRNANGRGGNAEVENAAVSPGGTMIAFWSRATNLFPGVTDGRMHLFISEIATGKVIGVVDTSKANVLSNDNDNSSGYRALAWAPREKGYSDSRFIAFGSNATNLGPATPEGWGEYLYVKNLINGNVSLLVYGVSEAAWSPDGTKIAFSTRYNYGTDANSENDIWAYDLDAPVTANLWDISTNSNGVFGTGWDAGSSEPSWSPDSTRVMFNSFATKLVPRDTNTSRDIFVKDLRTGGTTRVSTTSGGGQANSYSEGGTWSPDGSRIAFTSKADNLVRGDTNPDTDVFAKTLSTGKVVMVSTTSAGAPALFASYRPHWSRDGKRIAFMSNAVDLLPAPVVDSNSATDVYVKTLGSGLVRIVSITPDGRFGNSYSSLYEIGGYSNNAWPRNSAGIVFASQSTNLARSDRNAFGKDLFIKVL